MNEARRFDQSPDPKSIKAHDSIERAMQAYLEEHGGDTKAAAAGNLPVGPDGVTPMSREDFSKYLQDLNEKMAPGAAADKARARKESIENRIERSAIEVAAREEAAERRAAEMADETHEVITDLRDVSANSDQLLESKLNEALEHDRNARSGREKVAMSKMAASRIDVNPDAAWTKERTQHAATLESAMKMKFGYDATKRATAGIFGRLGANLRESLTPGLGAMMKEYRATLEQIRLGKNPESINADSFQSTTAMTEKEEEDWFHKGETMAVTEAESALKAAKEAEDYQAAASVGAGVAEKNRPATAAELATISSANEARLTGSGLKELGKNHAEVLADVEDELKDGFGMDIVKIDTTGGYLERAALKTRAAFDKKLRDKIKEYRDLQKFSEEVQGNR
jgi:hypothetical protein